VFAAVAALGVVLLDGAAGAVGGRGAASGGGPVAWVNGTPITKVTFNHWMTIAADASVQGAPGPTTKPAVPVPPHYTACIASLRRQLKAVRKGKTAPTTAELRSACAQEYQSYLQDVMQFLIAARWVLGEASNDGVHVSRNSVVSAFDAIKREQFPTPADYRSFLASSGFTRADLLLRVKLQLLSSKLRARATAGTGNVTSAQIAAYYNAHMSTYRTPENLDARIILTRTRAQAQAALHAVKHGTPFAIEAGKVSIDVATRRHGGLLTGVVRGQETRALSRALFSAPRRTLEGPVETPFGYYVFEVTKITPPTQLSLAQASPAIRQELISQAKTMALTQWVMAFTARWTARTVCRSGFVVEDCAGYKVRGMAITSATGRG
jgi:parvulin-like peptidyl-prolyl isomerase